MSTSTPAKLKGWERFVKIQNRRKIMCCRLEKKNHNDGILEISGERWLHGRRRYI